MSDLAEGITWVGFGCLAISLLGALGLQTNSVIRYTNPNPPVYRDVNSDGVKDKIVQRSVETEGPWWTKQYRLEDEVIYGIEINGKRIYLPKEQFDSIK